MIEKMFAVAFLALFAGGSVFAEGTDPLGFVLVKDSMGAWGRVDKAEEYNKDNVFELIDGEAELYFPYGLKRVVAADYAPASGVPAAGGASDDKEMKVSIEVYELASALDAFGVYSNYRDEESKPADVGTEGIAGTTQVMFYQDRFFVKARTNKTDRKEKLLEFARELSKGLPQQKSAPAEPALLDVKGVIPMSRQYIAKSVLGNEFFNHGLVAKAFLGDAPEKDVKPLRVFVLMERSPADAEKTVAGYVAYLDENQAAHQWVEGDGRAGARPHRVLKAEDPLLKGMLLEQCGRFVIGVAKLGPEMDGSPLLKRVEEKVAGIK